MPRARIINFRMIESDSFGQQDEVSSRYKKLDRIGKGTYGVVYLALDLKTNEEVALKKMIFHVASLAHQNENEGIRPPSEKSRCSPSSTTRTSCGCAM